MFKLNGRTIWLSQGDTGALVLRVRSRGYAFADGDKAVFTVRTSRGRLVMERAADIEADGRAVIPFLNTDTESVAAGSYRWDVRVVLGAETTDGRITGGRAVITPLPPGLFRIVEVVGHV